MLLFCVMPDHVHLVLLCNRDRAGRIAQAANLALARIAGPGMQPAHIRAVEDASHPASLLPYVLRQLGHHGLPGHAALWDGSVFQDLIGARLLGGFRANLVRAQPTFRLRDALAAVGLPLEPIQSLRP